MCVVCSVTPIKVGMKNLRFYSTVVAGIDRTMAGGGDHLICAVKCDRIFVIAKPSI